MNVYKNFIISTGITKYAQLRNYFFYTNTFICMYICKVYHVKYTDFIKNF